MKYTIILIILSLFFVIVAEERGEFWPDEIITNTFSLTIYQPQMESYDKITLSARSAISVTVDNNTYFGALWFKGKTAIDKDEQLVVINDVEIKDIRLLEDKVDDLKAKAVLALDGWTPVMTLQSVISDLDLLISEKEFSEKIKSDPPEIIFSTTPSVLILLDGEPVIKSVDGSKYEYVLNTPYFIVTKDNRIYYLKTGDLWYQSNDVLSGWSNTNSVPEDIKTLSEKEDAQNKNESDIAGISEDIIPEVIVRTMPAVLISTDGKPSFGIVEGTKLLYLKNTSANVILDKTTMYYYILTSGRWFKSETLDGGEWEFVAGDKLPEEFLKIPEDSEIAEVRVSIAQTDEAKEAVLESQIPQTVEIERATSTTDVKYDGKPQFKRIEDASLSYALNSDKTVLKVGNRYYCVDEGVWFVSNHYNGPWQVATTVPEEVYLIPPDEPIYNVRYVYIYDYTPTTVVVGYLPGYYGSYVHHGCIVYGTGYYYKPWHGHIFISRPWTYGYHLVYHPFYGWIVYYDYPWYWYGYYSFYDYHYHQHDHHYTYHKPIWKKKKPRPPLPFFHPKFKFKGKKIFAKKPLPGLLPVKKVLKTKKKPNNLFVDPKGSVYKKDNSWFKLKGKTWDKVKNEEVDSKKNVNKVSPKKKFISVKDYQKSRENAFFKLKKSNIGPNNNKKDEKIKKVKKKLKF